ARVGITRREHEVGPEAALSESMDIEQVIGRLLPICDPLLTRLVGRLGDMQGVVQISALVAHAYPEVRGLDGFSQVELKGVAVLVDLVDGRRKALGHVDGRMSDPPDSGTLFPFAEGVGVLERDLRDILQGKSALEVEATPVEGEGVAGQ